MAQGLPSLLQQLAQSVRSPNVDDESIYQLIEDVTEICLQGVTAENVDIVVSNLFDDQNGILSVIKTSSSNAVLKRSTIALLDCLSGAIKKYGPNIRSHADKIKDVCPQVYRKSTIAAVRISALQTLSEMLQSPPLASHCTRLEEVAKKFLMQELVKTETHVKATVKYEVLISLGLICKVSPSSMQSLSDGLAEKIIGILEHQMNRQRSPETSLVAGCFKSLYYFLSPFDRSEFPNQIETVFKCLCKAIDPNIKTTRYEVPKSALELLAKHGEQFRSQLLRSYKDVYDRLIAFSTSHNPDVRKCGSIAIESFLKQIGNELVDPIDDTLPEEKQKEIFNFFLKDFMRNMRGIGSSIKSVSQAIRSYGYFAAAIRKFQGEQEVREMLTILLEKCFQVYTSDEETTDSKMSFLPSFLQSLANIVKHTDTVDEGVSEPLRVIFSLTLEFFPKLGGALQGSCASAIIQFMYTVCGMINRPSRLLSDLVYQALLQTCIHPPVLEGEQVLTSSDGGNKNVSYKDYTQLWVDILSPRKKLGEAVSIYSLSELVTCMYGEVIKSLLKMCSKLNLALAPENDEEGRMEVTGEDSVSQSDINETMTQVAGNPVMIKDYQIIINISDLVQNVLVDTSTDLFNDWTFTYCHSIIKLSTQHPTVSSFYKLLTSAMNICSANNYFDAVTSGDGEDDNAMDILSESRGVACHKTHQLITKHQKKVVKCMRQYKDDLLISCLKFLFSLPVSVIRANLCSMSEALQVGLSLGLSYPPLIEQCLETLSLVFSTLEGDEKTNQLTLLLPYLDTFLQTSDHTEEESRETTRKILKNKQRLKLPPALLRLANEKTSSGRTEIQSSKLKVLQFLGELGGQDNQYVMKRDRREISQLAVSWSTTQHIKFNMPFHDKIAEIYLDKFLPRSCELAMSSSNRQTKVAACELVHSLVLLLLGNVFTKSQQMKDKKPADDVFKKLFPVLLQLAVDIELVAQQLFEPLVKQLIHWFTSNPQSKEAALLLVTIMEGVESVNNSALREFSAQCVAEYLKWTIKQTSESAMRKNSDSVKSILRQMYSMARHPSYSKRLGACLVYNHIYTILREETSLVDKFTMEILVCFVDCLALAHADELSLGTHSEAKKCLKHLERILKTKAALFSTRSKDRRPPTGWPPNATLKDAVVWLLGLIACPETECRHACIELITNLSPSLPAEMNSNTKLISYITDKEGIEKLRERCDGIYKTQDGQKAVAQLTSPFSSLPSHDEGLSVKSCAQWFDRVLASLDAYCWLIGTGLISASKIITGASPVFKVVSHFVNDVSTKSLNDFMPATGRYIYTPSEVEEFNRSKCTVTVRVFDFISVLIHGGKEVLIESGALSIKLWQLLGLCIVNPEAVGFNMADIEILTNLPSILTGVTQALKRIPDSLSQFEKSMKDILSDRSYKLSEVLTAFDMNSTEESHLYSLHVTSGYQLLSDAGILSRCLPDGSSTTELGLNLTKIVVKASSQRNKDPTSSKLLEAFYKLSISMDVDINSVVDMLYSDNSESVYSHVQQVLLKYMVGRGEPMIKAVMARANQSPHKTSIYLLGVLDFVKSAVASPDIQTRERASLLRIVDCMLDNWTHLSGWWKSSSLSSSTVTYCLYILKKSLLITSNMEKKKCFGEMIEFFTQTLHSSRTEHSQMCELLDVLPPFLQGTREQTEKVRSALQDYVNMRFPLKSNELPITSSGYHEYITAFKKILEAMVIGSDLGLLKIVLTIMCREETHVQEDIIQDYIRRFAIRMRKLQPGKQLEALITCFSMFKDSQSHINQTSRISALDRVLIPILYRVDKLTLVEFYKHALIDIKTYIAKRETKTSVDAWQVIIRDKTSCFKLVEFLYNSMLKDEVFSAASPLAKLWVTDDPTAATKADSWKNLTKDLIRICKDCVREDMRGETVHLELRRQMHCVSYNALIAIISNTQTNPAFYKQFIFSDDSVKGNAPLENICPKTPYVFETELSSLPVRKKKLVSVRQLMDDKDESSADTVIYMQTIADSSLTEDLAKYDFSYSQSLATSRQRNEEKEQEQLELLYPDSETVQSSSAKISQGYVELESDALNEHECMASFTSLLQHMIRHEITPATADQIDDLPKWMDWLREKMEGPVVPTNVKHLIARLILNNDKIFSPFSRDWLPTLVKYVTQCYEELHYFAMDIIVLILIWCTDANPQNDAVGRAMLNSLVEFIMKKAHHERRGIFKNNLDLLKNCLERWKSIITVNTSVIVDLLNTTTTDSKCTHILSAIQILGVIVANKIDPFHAPSCPNISKQQFYTELAKCMMNRLPSVYSSSAEVIGLVFNYFSQQADDNSKDFMKKYCEVVEGALRSLQVPSTKYPAPIQMFIVCLHSIQLHYPSFCDRFMTKVLFEIRRLYGDLRVKGLEIISSRIEHVEAPYKQLCDISFTELLSHRNSQIMLTCLKTLNNLVNVLTADQLSKSGWLPLVAESQSNGSAACRQISHSIFMSMYNKYSGDGNNTALVERCKENLLLALSDQHQPNRLIVQNFWSSHSMLSDNIITRLSGILDHMYNPNTESDFLSYATNLILELTSKSPNFTTEIFNHPLDECKFEDYAVNATWTQRFSTLAPMFADGGTQSLGTVASSLGTGMLRETQATHQFSATQDVAGPGKQRAYDWMTNSTLDASLDSSMTMGESSSLMFEVGTSSKKNPPNRPSTSRAGSRPKVSAHSAVDQVDNRINDTRETNSELSALRRRFIKDQDSSRIYFAKREQRRKKLEEEQKVRSKRQRENQVTLYRKYRIGDLPDIQIRYSAVIAPLQALAQRDSGTARMLFLVVFKAIMDNFATADTEKISLIHTIEQILRQSSQHDPAFIACLLELVKDLASDVAFPEAVVSDTGIQSKQQSIACVTLEDRLTTQAITEPKSKRRRTTVQSQSSNEEHAEVWTELARLYKSMENYDVVHSIISNKIGAHDLTRQAIELESKSNYRQAVEKYEQILNEQELSDLYEVNLIDDSRLDCMYKLTSWSEMESTILANLDNNLTSVWSNAGKDLYLGGMMKCGVRNLMSGKEASDFITFINESCSDPEKRPILEINHSEELAIIQMATKQFERASHYHRLATDRLLYEWSTQDELMVEARAHNLQSLQKLTEMGEFLSLMRNSKTDTTAAADLVNMWMLRSPGQLCSTSTWDDIITNRCFYTQMMDSMDTLDTHFIKERVDMRIDQARQAAVHDNVDLSKTILRSVLKDIQDNDMGTEAKLKWSAAGVQIKLKSANVPDIPLTTRIQHISAAVRNMDKYSNREAETIISSCNSITTYDWYSLKSQLWSSLLFSMLESSEGERTECMGQLYDWTDLTRGSDLIRPMMTHITSSVRDNIEKSMTTDVTSHKARAHMDMVLYADQCLRYSEEGGVDILGQCARGDDMACNLVISCTKALNLGSDDALSWLPRLLQIVELYPAVIPTFIEQSNEVPCWMLIRWISQMMALLDKEHCVAIHHIVEDILTDYPMAIIYPFKISYEGYTYKSAGGKEADARQFVERLKSELSKFTLVDTFIQAMEQLAQPEAFFSDWCAEMIELLTKNKSPESKEIESSYQNLLEQMFGQKEASDDASLYDRDVYVDHNEYKKQFSKTFRDRIVKAFGQQGEKISKLGSKKFGELCKPLRDDMRNMTAFDKKKKIPLEPPGLLKDYSKWLARFPGDLTDYKLEIPGQYGTSNKKPIPEHHVSVAGFDEKVMVMTSLRKPKRLVIRGDNERDYKFLVKCGEDLRQDQRIETVFTNINKMMSNSRKCKRLSLVTYNVIPMNTRLGLIEWIDDISPLKDVISDEATDSEKMKIKTMAGCYEKKHETGYIGKYSTFLSSECNKWFEEVKSQMRGDPLRRHLVKMSQTVESYYMLRDEFITSYAVICVSQYILGIGDRHLSNTVLDMQSGRAVGIDFGHAFGSATTHLRVPELVPFRLTGQILKVMEPYGTTGLFDQTMINVMRVMRENRRQLLNLLDIFIKEPSLDWMLNSRRQLQRADITDETVGSVSTEDSSARSSKSDDATEWYPKEKVMFAKLKLLGAHPRYITSEEFKLNQAVKGGKNTKNMKAGLSHINKSGDIGGDLRLSIEQQVKELIDQATDSNLVGRIWSGWQPYV